MKKKKKNSNYKNSFEAEKNSKKSSNNKFLIAFVCIFVAITVVVGLVLGIAAGVKNAKAAAKYEGTILTKEEVAFFASYYKYQFLSNLTKNGIEAKDTEEFWNSKCLVADTYGELLKYNTKEYIKQIIVANYIYDSYASLSSAEKKDIKLAASEILTYHADGNIDTFNLETDEYGFSYSDFEGIATKLYKARMADTVVFGNDGSKIAYEEELCKLYYSEYSRVKLLFIRTDKDFKLDEDGNRVQEDGQDVLVNLSEEEKAERIADIEVIRNAISALENGGEYQMSTAMYENYLNKYKSGDDQKDKNGFFFHEDSDYTEEFSEAFPEITELVFDMEVGSYKEVNTSIGICFIYKFAVDTDDMAYADTSDENGCFDDFYVNAATESFNTMIKEFSNDVVFTDKYDEFDLIKLPYNGVFVPRF